MKKINFIIWIVFTFCLLSPPTLTAEEAEEERRYCLKCHGENEAVKRFPDGDFISTYIDPGLIERSVHKSLHCTSCHKEFSGRKHPDRSFRSKLQYRIKESKGCRDCHPVGAIKSRAVHEPLLRKEKAGEAFICADCHSAHAVSPVVAGSVATMEETYCMTCHSQDNPLSFDSGKSISSRVHMADLKQSSHKNLSCSDCHFGFSSENHPRRRFRSERDYRLASSDICRRCHFDKYTKISETIHYNKLSTGRLEAPMCVDCHGGHAVVSMLNDRLSVVRKCRTCHNEVYQTYASSIHGSVLFNENNKDVPICTDCHTAHSIRDPFTADFHDHIPDMCSNCHSNETLMGKYGLSAEVVKTYLSDFHGMTISLYKKEARKRYPTDRPIAVCTDCHGTHDIVGMSGADIQSIKKKLLKRCQMCHSDATENFPEAWLSHYKPSFTVAPMVFIVEKFYSILMPLMAAGLIFQIFLHIWRYLVNR